MPEVLPSDDLWISHERSPELSHNTHPQDVRPPGRYSESCKLLITLSDAVEINHALLASLLLAVVTEAPHRVGMLARLTRRSSRHYVPNTTLFRQYHRTWCSPRPIRPESSCDMGC